MREKLEKQLKKEKEMREIRTINESTKQKVESGQSKIKPIKFGKQSGTTYCFGCKDYTKNFRPEKVKMIKYLEKNLIVLFLDLINQDF